jgi:uncharacterized cysteine cluster protein YcgN (CxxCxxCC family)
MNAMSSCSDTKSKFWREKSLFEMSVDEWESVCDGCGKCCLQQLEDESSGELVFTDLACDLLDTKACRCTDYENRRIRVPDCMTLNKSNVAECAAFAPPSCAYRLLLQGEDLPSWHHLQSGHRNSIHAAGRSVAEKVINKSQVADEELEDHIVDWP